MPVRAGIDEAGLGPLLGPLTLGYSGFRGGEGEHDLWRALASAVSSEPGDDRTHLVVADSKRVFTRDPRGHARLERTALAFLGLVPGRDGPPRDGRELFACTTSAALARADRLAEEPWHPHLPERLPQWCSPASLAEARERLEQALAAAGIELVAAGQRIVSVAELNESFRRTDSKGTTLWLEAAELIAQLWRDHGHEGLELWLDRQGGRTHYESQLCELFPLSACQVERESASSSRYRLQEGGGRRRMSLIVTPKAEQASLPVALASCLAKYARETAMAAFQRCFEPLLPGVRPTAGYVSDARRWLAEAGPRLASAGIDPARLVRER